MLGRRLVDPRIPRANASVCTAVWKMGQAKMEHALPLLFRLQAVFVVQLALCMLAFLCLAPLGGSKILTIIVESVVRAYFFDSHFPLWVTCGSKSGQNFFSSFDTRSPIFL